MQPVHRSVSVLFDVLCEHPIKSLSEITVPLIMRTYP